MKPLPALPSSWTALSWQQLCQVWEIKQRYGSNADIARAAALLALLGCTVCRETATTVDPVTGETCYCLRSADGHRWTATAREIAYMAKKGLSWFDYPYGDPGEKEQKDGKGKVVKEGREPVRGYVSTMRDAMILPISRLRLCLRNFTLPQLACNNLTWQQYRSLQNVTGQLFGKDVTDSQAVRLQAEFLAHILTPRSFALFDTAGGSISIRPHYEYRYNAEQAEGQVGWFVRKMMKGSRKTRQRMMTLFNVCFQTYQTAIVYYSQAYPLLFSDDGKADQLRDALQGEVGTVNTVMKYAGYAEQQQVYDSNLPFILDILNTMTKEAKEIEQMNAKLKK